MVPHRFVVLIACLTATAVSFFTLGELHQRREAVVNELSRTTVDTIRSEVRREMGKMDLAAAVLPAGTAGSTDLRPAAPRARMVDEIKQELQSEMGLIPLQLLRERRSSFVELYSTDNYDKTNYGTAGYLGHGYFITVKHAVVALSDDAERPNTRKIGTIKIMYGGKELPARLIDTG